MNNNAHLYKHRDQLIKIYKTSNLNTVKFSYGGRCLWSPLDKSLMWSFKISPTQAFR